MENILIGLVMMAAGILCLLLYFLPAIIRLSVNTNIVGRFLPSICLSAGRSSDGLSPWYGP